MNSTLKKEIEFPVKNRFLVDDKEYQVKETGDTRERVRFAWLPIYLGLPDLIPLPGCKFTWLRKVKVTEKKVMYRTTEFDDGWSYQSYWTGWSDKWIIIDLVRV